jgi:hypothetical protein
MTLAELTTATRYYLDDTSLARWTDTEIYYYINRAYQYYWNKLVNAGYKSLCVAPVLLDITSGVDTIALPTDFYKARRVDRLIDTKIIPLQYKENFEDVMLTTGVTSSTLYTPSYTFQGNNLLLEPLPSFSATSALQVSYWPVMTKLANTTDSPVAGFNAQWQDLIPIRAAFIAKSNREEEDVENIYRDLKEAEVPFEDALTEMTQSRSYTEPFITGGYGDAY